MNEVATILGGLENVEQAILNIAKRAKPDVIGICSTGVTETKGDDVDGYHPARSRKRHPELDHLGIVYVSTPDFKDAFQDGLARPSRSWSRPSCPKRQAARAARRSASTCCRAAI